MNILHTGLPTTLAKNLPIGMTCLYGGHIYMRIDLEPEKGDPNSVRSICLNNGKHSTFSSSDTVIPLPDLEIKVPIDSPQTLP